MVLVTWGVMSADAVCPLVVLCVKQGSMLKKQEGVILQEGNFGPHEEEFYSKQTHKTLLFLLLLCKSKLITMKLTL